MELGRAPATKATEGLDNIPVSGRNVGFVWQKVFFPGNIWLQPAVRFQDWIVILHRFIGLTQARGGANSVVQKLVLDRFLAIQNGAVEPDGRCVRRFTWPWHAKFGLRLFCYISEDAHLEVFAFRFA